jgi:hypothetical protein
MKQLGVGLAAAIFIDATLVRAVLLPATMKLLGARNWYLPRRLPLAAAARPRAERRAGRRLSGTQPGADRGARRPAGAACASASRRRRAAAPGVTPGLHSEARNV